MASIPADLKYTRSHEWVRVDGDVATVGITDFAQGELGDITYLELPDPGTGVVATEPNDDAVAGPDVVNASPYEDAWLIRVRLSGSAALENLMSASDYEMFIQDKAS